MPSSAGLVRAKTTERLVASLPAPPALAGGSAVVRRVEVPALPTPPVAASAGRVYGSSRVDDHGRLRDAVFFGSLGWKPSIRLAVSLRTDGASLSLAPVASGTAEGSVVLDGKGRLGLPLALRQVVGATAGALVFLLGDPATGTATAYSTTALDQMTGATYDAA